MEGRDMQLYAKILLCALLPILLAIAIYGTAYGDWRTYREYKKKRDRKE
jgi:hypothetical protein